MTFTTVDRDNLKVAIATGVLRTRVNGRETEFRSLAEMRTILAMMEEEIANAAAPKPKQYRFSTSSGTSSRNSQGNW